MVSKEKLNTHQKALGINLDPTSYGSFAEIGAGQEVARWFLVVGGASGTVAKSISAYDKEVSDDIYGSGARYVSKERLQAMLDSEWTQLIHQLNKSHGSHTCFFSFVDTISARNYAGTNEPHGWVGLRFQLELGGRPNDIVLHINMRDSSNPLQQEAIGILGVNLIYAAFYQLETKESFFENVAQDVEKRVEIDYVELRGPAFEGWDQRAILARTAEVTTLDEWLRRNERYDLALRTLYEALIASDGRVNDEVRAAFSEETAARADLPPDTRGLVLIIAEAGRGGLNNAVIDIETLRGRLFEAIEASTEASPEPSSG